VRILVCNYEFPPVGGGGGNACRYLVREWQGRGHPVTVVTSHWQARREEEWEGGVRIIRVPVRRRRLDCARLVELLAYVRQGRREVRRLWEGGGKFEVVVSFFAVPSGLVGDGAARLWGVPHLVRLGGGDVPGHERRWAVGHVVLRPTVGRLLRRAAARVANSRGLRARAQRVYRLPCEVIENGVDLQEFVPAEQGPPHDPPVVLFVARLIARKGLQFLLPALAQLQREGVRFRLIVVGDGPQRAALQRQAEGLGLGARVEWLGRVEHDKLPEVYRRGDVFVLPSLSEGMANVLLEAMACGLPVVVTRVPGSEELVSEGENGFVVEPGQVGALVGPLRALLQQPHLRQRMGASSRQRAQAYGWPHIAARYLELMEELLRRGRGSARA
jgi:glycosyltransferase involved in cell wall biosynthesis